MRNHFFSGQRLFDHFGHHLVHHAMGRHHGGWGGGPAMSDDPEVFGEGLRRGRKFSAEDLQLVLLWLLGEKPSHGYELIKALETRTSGYYKPSPGVVYPALTYLEETGLANVDAAGNRKLYHLSDEGRAFLDANRERLELMLARLLHVARKMEHMRRAMAGEGQAEGEAAAGESGWLPEFVAARRTLKRTLMLLTDASPDEQRRIAAILTRAIQEIEQGNP